MSSVIVAFRDIGGSKRKGANRFAPAVLRLRVDGA
jgi:hypothetical protein